MISLLLALMIMMGCEDEPRRGAITPDGDDDSVIVDKRYFGADLSYVNQILDHGGVYQVNGVQKDPYQIFADKGTNLVRLRLWHNPAWTKTVYGAQGTQLYNDLKDVEESIQRAKAQKMQVLLDFHYSDEWADPEKQYVPAAWKNITSLDVLADSVYDYTYAVLNYLDSKNLMPELVQVGNETNCGMMLSRGNAEFPNCNVCDGNWSNFGTVAQSAIRAIREVNADTKILFHVADPKNVSWWFNGLINTAKVTDFDMIGFSYYPIWHTTVKPGQLESTVKGFLETYKKEVIILETAYPWTTQGNDSYPNLFGSGSALSGYPFTPEGQNQLMTDLMQSMISAGGSGMVYWEPAWITSDLRDQWNKGSSWENNAFFDYDGNANSGFDYMTHEYSSND